MKHFFRSQILFLGIAISCLANEQASHDKKTITFGMSGSFSGHFGVYGNMIKKAILAAFKNCNDAGGMHGHTLDLCAMDDESDPMTTKKNIESMHQDKQIDMFLGVMGTRGIFSVLPMVKDKKISILFPWGSDALFRDASLRYMINGPGLLQPQTDALARYIVDDLHIDRVAVFHADDDFSIDASKAFIKDLEAQEITPIGVAQYNRFTMDIQTPAKMLTEKDPRVVVCVGTSMPTTKLINNFFENGQFGTTFLGIDSTFLVNKILGSKGARFKYSSAVPDPKTSSIALAKEYCNALQRYFPDEEPTALSFTYYVCASIVIQALKMVEGDITQEAVIAAIEKMKNYDLHGFTVDFDASNRHAFGKKVWII